MDPAPVLDLSGPEVVAPEPRETRALLEHGWVVVPDALDPAVAADLAARVDRLLLREGDAAGSEFAELVAPGDRARYLGRLLAKGEAFARCVREPRVLGLARLVLDAQVRVHAVNARAPMSGGGGAQQLHPHLGLVNVLWLLDDMRADNGPTQVVPGTGWLEPDVPEADLPRAVTLEAPAGSAIVLHPHVLHGGTATRSARPRRIVTVAYSAPDLAPQGT